MNRIAIPSVVLLCVVLSACSSPSKGAAPSGTGGFGPDAAASLTGGSTALGGASGGITTSGGASATGGTMATSGAATAGGTTGAAGASVAGGAMGTGGVPPAVSCTAEYVGSATRPLLTDASAACYSVKNYLAEAGPLSALVRDDWDPTAGLPAASSYTPTYTVAADGSGSHTTVQAAIDAANASASTSRVYILVKPGAYRELVCVKGSVAITLYGADSDASTVTIAFNNYADKQVANQPTNACASPGSSATFGTTGSSTFFVSSSDFQAANLTIANDFDESTVPATAKVQAVALTVQGDKGVFENVRLIGNQDTLQVKSPLATTVARSYFRNSYIEGDTDFIFGRGAAVFDGCTITYVSVRKNSGTVIAPSTNSGNPFGFLIVNSKMLGDAGMTAGTAYLGRAWDDSSDPQANGQAVIRNTEIGGFVRLATPWATSTGGRVFSASGNRLYEYQNTGMGAAPGGVDGGAVDGGGAVDAGVDAPPAIDVAASVEVSSGQSDGGTVGG